MDELYCTLWRWIGGILNVEIEDNKDFHDGIYFMKLIELLTNQESVSQAKMKIFENIQIFLDSKYDINTSKFIDYEQFLGTPDDEQVVYLSLFIIGLLHFMNERPAKFSQKDLASIENLIKPISDHLSMQVPLTEKALSLRISQFMTGEDASNSIMYSSEISTNDINNSGLEQHYEYLDNSFTGNYKKKERKRQLVYNHKTPTRASRMSNKNLLNYKAKISEYEQEIQELQYRLECLQNEMDEKSERIKILTNTKTQLMKEKCDLEDIAKTNDEQIQILNKSIDRLTNENEILKTKLGKDKSGYKKLEQSIQSLEKENDNLIESSEKLKKTMIQKDNQLEEYEHLKHESDMEHARLQNQLERLMNRNYELSEEFKIMNKNRVVNINDSTYSNPYTEIEEGENMVMILETQVRELSDELGKQRTDNVSLQKTILEKQQKIESLKQSLMDMKTNANDINSVVSNFENLVHTTTDSNDLLYITNRVRNVLQLNSSEVKNCANCEADATTSLVTNNKDLHDRCRSELSFYHKVAENSKKFEAENTDLLLKNDKLQEENQNMKLERFELNRAVTYMKTELEKCTKSKNFDSILINDLKFAIDKLSEEKNQLLSSLENQKKTNEHHTSLRQSTLYKIEPYRMYFNRHVQTGSSRSPNKRITSHKTTCNPGSSKSKNNHFNRNDIDEYMQSTPLQSKRYVYQYKSNSSPKADCILNFSSENQNTNFDNSVFDSLCTLSPISDANVPHRSVNKDPFQITEPSQLHKENRPPHDSSREELTVRRSIYSPSIYPERLDTLRERNQQQPAHLKTSYPVETQAMNSSFGANWVCTRSEIPISDNEDTYSIVKKHNNPLALSPLVSNEKGGATATFKKPYAFPKSSHEIVNKNNLRKDIYNKNSNVCGFGLTGSNQMVNEYIKANCSRSLMKETGNEVMSARDSNRNANTKHDVNRSQSARENKGGESLYVEFSPKKKLGPGSKKKTYDTTQKRR